MLSSKLWFIYTMEYYKNKENESAIIKHNILDECYKNNVKQKMPDSIHTIWLHLYTKSSKDDKTVVLEIRMMDTAGEERKCPREASGVLIIFDFLN